MSTVRDNSEIVGEGDYEALLAVLTEETITLRGESGTCALMPPEMVQLLRSSLAALAEDQIVEIAPANTTVSTQKAAAFLGVSRPTLVKLLEDGAIDFERPGTTHRRVSVASLIDYQEWIRSRRGEILDESARDAAEQDSCRRFNGFVDTRS